MGERKNSTAPGPVCSTERTRDGITGRGEEEGKKKELNLEKAATASFSLRLPNFFTYS